MAITVYKRAAKTGGAVSALDGIDGTGLLDGDFAFVMDGSAITPYLLDADSSGTDDGENIIAPDLNAGTKRWLKHTFASRAHDLLHVRDEKTGGTAGGGSSAGTQTRTVQTVKVNEITGASLGASNDITLPAGTYDIDIRATVGGAVGLHKLRLYNTTTAAYITASEGLNATATAAGVATLVTTLTLAAPSVLEIRHYTQNAVATVGLGAACSNGLEVYLDGIFKRRKYA